ncbi:hypothetical protein NC651_024391 [Populus alba x Populus x berolinensis]|nr:hypothetical protein NC651_024391 [Populus alba x Populus x berolinensis]
MLGKRRGRQAFRNLNGNKKHIGQSSTLLTTTIFRCTKKQLNYVQKPIKAS